MKIRIAKLLYILANVVKTHYGNIFQITKPNQINIINLGSINELALKFTKAKQIVDVLKKLFPNIDLFI